MKLNLPRDQPEAVIVKGLIKNDFGQFEISRLGILVKSGKDELSRSACCSKNTKADAELILDLHARSIYTVFV